MATPLRSIEYAIEKWGARPHYRGTVLLLGEDEHGTWLWGPRGRTVRRGETPMFTTEQDAVFLVVPGGWWSLTWWLGHPEVALYVNIQTPAAWDGDRLVATDLDLDVIRFCDGRVETVDRDEFDLHQQRYGYPAALVAAAERATAEAFERTAANDPPFDGVAAAGWERHARRFCDGA
jgi:protein associated with RNAse G/E